MTREEAINEIKKTFTHAYANYIITALTEGATISDKRNCDDLISREEVKKLAKEMYLEVANMELDVKTISDCISYTASKCREVFERKLQELPSVQPQEPRWIPVTERLPNDSGRYLVNYSSGNVSVAYYYNLIHMWNSTIIERIVAWMPLPENYKEMSE